MGEKPCYGKFVNSVWQTLKKVPRGQVASYGDLARAVGNPTAARAVGSALRINPYAPQVPCHRVVKNDGTLGGFAHGINKKKALLREEGIKVKAEKIVNFSKIKYKFK